jgi:hypothetical protein
MVLLPLICSIVSGLNVVVMFIFISKVWDRILNSEVYKPKQENEEEMRKKNDFYIR